MTRPSVLEIMAAAKACGWTVILGGPESANYCEEYLAAGADVIVIGEGEVTLDELLQALPRHGRRALHEVRGIVFRDDSAALVRTPERAKIPDLDALPLPGPRRDRSCSSTSMYGVSITAPAASTSSPPAAVPTSAPGARTPSTATRTAAAARPHVAREVEQIVARYHPEQLWYADDVFTISHPWLLQLCGASCASAACTCPSRPSRAPIACRARPPREALARARLLPHLDRLGERQPAACWTPCSATSASREVHRAVELAHRYGMQVGMFLMWGYEGEELEDIAATVDLVRSTNPEIFLTTVSYPIKGTPYFDGVRERVRLPRTWAEASDRDYAIEGRRGRDYYRLADVWLRSEVEAGRVAQSDPARAAQTCAGRAQARDALARSRCSERAGPRAKPRAQHHRCRRTSPRHHEPRVRPPRSRAAFRARALELVPDGRNRSSTLAPARVSTRASTPSTTAGSAPTTWTRRCARYFADYCARADRQGPDHACTRAATRSSWPAPTALRGPTSSPRTSRP